MDTARWTKDECTSFEDPAVTGNLCRCKAGERPYSKIHLGAFPINSMCQALVQYAIDVYACHPARYLDKKVAPQVVL